MSFALGSKDPFVTRWKRFLNGLGRYDCGVPSQDFDSATDAATRQFQKDNKLKVDGVVGGLTIGTAASLGFSAEGEPSATQIRTTRDLLLWIKTNLGGLVQAAIAGSGFTEDWLGAMAAREVGFLITRYVNQGLTPDEIHGRMLGDYGRRDGDSEKIFHGYGYWQIDIASYPDFVNSGDWKDPLKTAHKAVEVLNEKRQAVLAANLGLDTDTLERATTAAYNCGQGRVIKALRAGADIDTYTFSQNYSAEVFRNRKIYLGL